MTQEKRKLAWYETDSPLLIVGLLIIFFPLGLWSMWRYTSWSLKTKGIITSAVVLLALISSRNSSPSPTTTTTQSSAIADNCLNASESSIQGMSWGEIDTYKKQLKQQSGKSCVLFTK
jgi:hypothetical protein